VASITDSAPGTLDTLNELAAALGDDPNFATTTANNIATKVSKSGDVITTTGTNNQAPLQLRSASGLRHQFATDAQDDAYYYMYDNTGSNTVAFRTDGNPSFIAGGGNVGIGTSSPSYPLDINGGTENVVARISSTDADALIVFEDNSTTDRVLLGAQGEDFLLRTDLGKFTFRVNNNATDGMVILNNGNVGIGTDAPGAPLEVHHASIPIAKIKATTSSGQAALYLDGYHDGGSTHRASRINFRKDTTTEWSIINDYTQNDSNTLDFEYAGSRKVTFTGDGKVGIGTDNPDGPLHVKSGSNVTLKLDATLADGLGSFTSMAFARNGTNKWRFFQYGDDSRLAVINDLAGNYEQISLASNGSVGIGTSNPLARTHIHGSGDLLRLTSTNSGIGGAQIDLIHQSPSPADGDYNGMINMGGYYSGTSSAYATAIRSVWTNAGGRQGRLEFYTRNAGDFTKQFQIEHDGDIYSWRVNNWEPIVAGGFSGPSIAYTSSQSFDITPTYPTYSGVRTNSSKYKYFRLEADIRSTAANHYGFFWGADQANLGYNNGVAGYKWVYRDNNNQPEFRDLNTNGTFKTMNAVSHAHNDGVFHRWVMEVLPSGVTLYADGVLVDYLPNNYVAQGYCGIHTYSSGDTLQCRNVVITSLDSVQQEAVHYSTHSLAGAADGIYKMVNTQGMMQEVYVSNGWMLIAANDARDALFPNGNSRQNLQYTVNRNGAQGHFGEPSPDNDYLIGGFIDDFSFSKIKIEAWGWGSTNSTYNYANQGDNASAEWSASSLTTVVPRSSVTIGGNFGIYSTAAYFNGDGIRVDYNNGGFSANLNQTTIGGVGVNGSSGDPTTGCYMGHGSNESGSYSEGWYRASGNSANCQGYTTWVKS
jgi:hypothetical protein